MTIKFYHEAPGRMREEETTWRRLRTPFPEWRDHRADLAPHLTWPDLDAAGTGVWAAGLGDSGSSSSTAPSAHYMVPSLSSSSSSKGSQVLTPDKSLGRPIPQHTAPSRPMPYYSSSSSSSSSSSTSKSTTSSIPDEFMGRRQSPPPIGFSSSTFPAPMPDESMGRLQGPPPIPAQAAPPGHLPAAPARQFQGPRTIGLFNAFTEMWQGVAGGALPSSSGQGREPPPAEASRESANDAWAIPHVDRGRSKVRAEFPNGGLEQVNWKKLDDAEAQAQRGREENDQDQQGPLVPCDAGLLLQIPRNEAGELTTVGSIGHGKPGVECNPCSYWFKGMCILGVQCQHCHFLHEGQKSKRLRPNKSMRAKMRSIMRAGAEAGDDVDFEPGDCEDFSPHPRARAPVDAEPRKAPPPGVFSMPSCMPRQGGNAGVAPETGQLKTTMSL